MKHGLYVTLEMGRFILRQFKLGVLLYAAPFPHAQALVDHVQVHNLGHVINWRIKP